MNEKILLIITNKRDSHSKTVCDKSHFFIYVISIFLYLNKYISYFFYLFLSRLWNNIAEINFLSFFIRMDQRYTPTEL